MYRSFRQIRMTAPAFALLVGAGLAVAVVVFMASRSASGLGGVGGAVVDSDSARDSAVAGVTAKAPLLSDEVSHLEVARAVMVTVELDLGPKTSSVSDALSQIERQSKPDDGKGRTFSILDAYGEPTRAGKLHLSMHVSAEKPGAAALVFRPTGAPLWRAQIIQGTNAPAPNFAAQGLVILLDNGAGQTVTVDGSNQPRSILDARVKEMGVSVGEIWPDGSQRQCTFLYSACGCPVKVMALRVGEKTVRTSNVPVIFPDDPAVASAIQRIMRWE